MKRPFSLDLWFKAMSNKLLLLKIFEVRVFQQFNSLNFIENVVQ